MPGRGHHKTRADAPRKAAELYLQCLRDGDSITVADAASRYGVSKGAVFHALKQLREAAS